MATDITPCGSVSAGYKYSGAGREPCNCRVRPDRSRTVLRVVMTMPTLKWKAEKKLHLCTSADAVLYPSNDTGRGGKERRGN